MGIGMPSRRTGEELKPPEMELKSLLSRLLEGPRASTFTLVLNGSSSSLSGVVVSRVISAGTNRAQRPPVGL